MLVNVREIMQATEIRMRSRDTLRRALELLKSSKLNIVPVVDERGKLAGYFSRSHLFDCLVEDVSLDTAIEKYYSRDAVYCREDKSYDTLEEVSHWLKTIKVGQTLVVNADDEPIGVLTQAATVIDLLGRTDFLYRELSSVIENVPAGIVATDASGVVTLANQYAKEILQGLGAGKEIGECLRDLRRDFSPVTRGEWMTPRKIEHRSLALIATAVPVYQSGRVKGVIFIIQDLTQVEGIAHELRAVKELKTTLETVLEVAYEGVAVLDEQGSITLANGRLCKKLGLSREEMIGRDIKSFIPAADNGQALQVLEIESKPCIVSCLPITREDGSMGSVIKVYEDLDDLTDVMQQLNRLNLQLDYYKAELYKVNGTSYTIKSIVSGDGLMEKMKSQVIQAARSNSTVLITGESGTGKELFAHSIHNASSRSKEPFVKVNCSAIPAELAEAELFGYQEGAFTGARKQGKAGKFELAAGGTIFLDEIGDMPLLLQGKLLRVIQEKEVERVGDTRTRKVDVRIIAATNRDLKRLVEEGKFREDLYFRIDVVEFKIPSLRERRGDIPLLVEHFIGKYSKLFARRVNGIAPAALEALKQYDWPGNVRELENIVERMLNYVESGRIELQDVPEKIRSSAGCASPTGQSLAVMEQAAIQAALAEVDGNKSKAARLLGISRSKLYEKLSQLQ